MCVCVCVFMSTIVVSRVYLFYVSFHITSEGALGVIRESKRVSCALYCYRGSSLIHFTEPED